MNSRIILIDALGVIYRSFYAIKALATSAGRPTNAVYGFIKTFAQIRRVWQPTHVCVVFDGGLPEKRKKLLETYKSQRPPMPDQLRLQLDDIREYLDAARLFNLRVEGQEADDVLASIAVQAADSGLETLVVSSDKDLLQIAGGKISLVAPGKIEDKIGPAEVKLKTGVLPEQIVEWLAMVGDSSDNIPGVPGIGAKTAAKLLGQWGSLGEILANLERLDPEKTRRLLQEHRETVLRNVELITLDKRLPLSSRPEDMLVELQDGARLQAFFKRLEFHSLAAELDVKRAT